MSRPPKARILGSAMSGRGFRPYVASGGAGDDVVLTLDEAEALRLADLEGLYQQAAARHMGVSRPTFGRIIESARRKTADALLNGKKLRIAGGVVEVQTGDPGPLFVAVPLAPRGKVEAHFGRCQRLVVYSIASDGTIGSEQAIEVSIGPGCRSNVIPRLAAMRVQALVAGCIGDGAIRVCSAHGIEVVRGATGAARGSALAYARGELHDSGLACGRTCKETPPKRA
jgi:predicted DNA-binding protein (UPF0251 family)/predicted Fe-Mo cluster-binding NifX family protein